MKSRIQCRPSVPFAVHLLLNAPKGGYTLVALPRIVTPYRDSVDGNRARVTYQKFVYAVTLRAFFGVLSVFGRRIKGMIRLRPEQVWTCNVTSIVTPYRDSVDWTRARVTYQKLFTR